MKNFTENFTFRELIIMAVIFLFFCCFSTIAVFEWIEYKKTELTQTK